MAPRQKTWDVEVVTKARVTHRPDAERQWEYFVKWADCGSDEDTWEPMENLKTCDRLLESFWTHIGGEEADRRYNPGYMVEAQPEWIAQEKQYFADEYRKGPRKPRKSLKNAETQSSVVSSSSKATRKAAVNKNGSEPEDEPLSIRTSRRKRLAVLSDDDSATRSQLGKKPRPDLISTSISTTALTSNKAKQQETTPTSPTSLFSGRSSPAIAPVTPPPPAQAQSGGGTASTSHVPNHHEQRTNPRIKLLPLESKHVAGGSVLSTKQRLAQLAVAGTSTNPKAVPARTGLMPLSLKKKPQVLREASPPVEDRFFSGDAPASPNTQEYIPLVEHDVFEAFLPINQPDVQGPSLSDALNPLTSAEEVFLQSVVPKELAAPLAETIEQIPAPSHALVPVKPMLLPKDTIEQIPDPAPSRALVPAKPTLLPKIPKKWKWTGKLTMVTGTEQPEFLCDIMLTDATEHLADGPHLSVIFSSIDSIQFSRLHNVSDVDTVLLACNPVYQLAKLGPQGDDGADALKRVVRYMDNRRQVAFVPLSLDSAAVGQLLVFPSTMDELYHQFKVPAHLQQNGALVSVLLLWALPAAKRQEESRKPLGPDGVPFNTLGSERREVTLKTLPNYHRAIQALQFPEWVYDYMSQPNRPYCIWWTPADGTPKEPGIETKFLHAILKQCHAKDVGHKADVRAVFVHVGALKSLHGLPALAERRSRHLEIPFFTYGTHEDVVPDRWGVRQIFPLGGIVTFTPKALVEDPVGAYKLIARLVRHRLWACYILPSTIGMAAKLTSLGADPLFVHDNGGFIFGPILALVEQGDVSLIRAPPTRRAPAHGKDPAYHWVGRQLAQQQLDPRGRLETCLADFAELCADVPEPGWAPAMEAEICADMLNMQRQPVLMDGYRRFVVIRAVSEGHLSSNKSGMEWLPASEFTFKDNYFRSMK